MKTDNLICEQEHLSLIIYGKITTLLNEQFHLGRHYHYFVLESIKYHRKISIAHLLQNDVKYTLITKKYNQINENIKFMFKNICINVLKMLYF